MIILFSWIVAILVVAFIGTFLAYMAIERVGTGGFGKKGIKEAAKEFFNIMFTTWK